MPRAINPSLTLFSCRGIDAGENAGWRYSNRWRDMPLSISVPPTGPGVSPCPSSPGGRDGGREDKGREEGSEGGRTEGGREREEGLEGMRREEGRST